MCLDSGVDVYSGNRTQYWSVQMPPDYPFSFGVQITCIRSTNKWLFNLSSYVDDVMVFEADGTGLKFSRTQVYPPDESQVGRDACFGFHLHPTFHLFYINLFHNGYIEAYTQDAPMPTKFGQISVEISTAE